MDPATILGAFGLNIAVIVGAAMKLARELGEIRATLSGNLKDVGRVELKVEQLERDLGAAWRELRSLGAAPPEGGR